jgi:hypothetical protein
VNNRAVLLIGGPDTGKSNFLFRAWTQIDSSTGLVVKDGLPADVEYLQSGVEFQLRGEFAVHTSQEVQVISNIPIRSQSDPHKNALLVVPDINGEQINRIYHERKWSFDWESLITESTAYLFFVRVNSQQTIAPLDWIAWHKLYCGTPAPIPSADRQASESAKIVEKKVETPTQVVLVDWLQFILKTVHDKHSQAVRPKVGIVVTAWDCVAIDFQGGPSEWIKENMPLLHQFCITNESVFEFSFFGTSIFSGDPINDLEFKAEISQKDPRKLGYIRHSSDNRKSDDFTIPITWALDW